MNDMRLFTAQINNWTDWSNVFQSISAFTPLVEYILKNEHLPIVEIEHLTPGTNAVFKVGGYVIKIFAPAESGMDQTPSFQSELFATHRAASQGVAVPQIIAVGSVQDKYRFAYMITEYIVGVEFWDAVKTMTDCEKVEIGRRLRTITDKMNTPCEPFNNIDVIHDKDRWRRWDKYPESFRTERISYITSHDYGEKVFVHGDLCGDNMLLSPDGELYIIDFGDAVLAPVIYEHAHMAVVTFDFNPKLLLGYFGEYDPGDLAARCFDGLLIHDFGGDIVAQYIGKPDEFKCLEQLRERLRQKLNAGGDLA